MQTIQNKCIRFCLQLDCRSHTGIKKFEQINWLLVSERFNPCICSNTFKFFNENCPLYLYDLYKPSGQDQNTLSYLTPTIWNNLPTCLKLSNSLNSFKYGVKEHFFKKLKNKEQDIFAYWSDACCVNIYFKLLLDIRKCFCWWRCSWFSCCFGVDSITNWSMSFLYI